MKRKKSPWEERRSKRETVGQIASWCLLIALNQTEGIGRERLERVSGVVSGIQCEIAALIDEEGTEAGIRALQKRMDGIGPTEMRVPLNRGVKNRREQELRAVGDQIATMAWCCWALGAHEVLGFGRARLERLHQNTLENYRQFNGWYAEDHAWAFEKLRHCAQQALNEQVSVVDTVDDDPIKVRDAQTDAALLMRQAVCAQNEQNRKKQLRSMAGNVLSDTARRAAAEKISQELFGKEKF